MIEYKYAGFISYAHADEAMAARLHHALETFKIPGDISLSRDRKLHPIFRDTTELTAHHSLSEKIQDAVNSSRFLIVLCSSAAKSSHWVNEEIRLFRKLHGENSILCALLEGSPKTSFPPALIEGGREPLAANLSGGRAGFRLGTTQLAASMLNVGLDALIQRETKRRRIRNRLLTAGSMVFAALMGGMAWTAENAREAAEISRTEAENMVEFILTDLKQDLEPIGKRDILNNVGNRVSDYYDAIPIPDMDDDRLARQARARHFLGQLALDQRKMKAAKTEIEAAYQATAEVLRRNPDDTNAIFAHAQSAYWAGEMANIVADYHTTLSKWHAYDALGARLYEFNPMHVDWIMEAAWGQHNLGVVTARLDRHETALVHYRNAIHLFSKAHELAPESSFIDIETSNTLGAKSATLLKLNQYEAALKARTEEIKILEAHQDHVEFGNTLILSKLNYWKIRNSINDQCNQQYPVELLNDLKKYNEKDTSNLRWKVNYLAYWREYIQLSKKDFSQDELKTRVENMTKFANANGLSSEKYSHLLMQIGQND